jgi:hypothetical protein
MGNTFDNREEISMRVVEFYARKGGQGVTTTACLYGIKMARSGIRTHLQPVIDQGDMEAVLGMPDLDNAKGWAAVDNALSMGLEVPPGVELLVRDDDTEGMILYLDPEVTDRYLVTRPCFLALRRLMRKPAANHTRSVLLLSESGRALDDKDVRSVVGLPVIGFPLDPSVARAVDAGLLVGRTPRDTNRVFDILDRMTVNP